MCSVKSCSSGMTQNDDFDDQNKRKTVGMMMCWRREWEFLLLSFHDKVFSKQYSQERMISISSDLGVVVGDSFARKCPFPWLSDTSVVQLKRMDFGLLLAFLLGNQTHPRKRSLLEDQHRDCCSFHSTQGSRLFRLLRSLTWRRRRRATSCAE